ncbi:hypothetical protein LTR36_010951 [Oleoguttula mirabilis]|uniref:mitogen-activated protein kinase kinase n=1 Tax=Oleoguttula mirabilis TaxID=1507867 RepID=A0AAV9J4C9_9PEZI|nr:hypothetical protein LTR36_010951 [Oleoguttula mirabilis]
MPSRTHSAVDTINNTHIAPSHRGAHLRHKSTSTTSNSMHPASRSSCRERAQIKKEQLDGGLHDSFRTAGDSITHVTIPEEAQLEMPVPGIVLSPPITPVNSPSHQTPQSMEVKAYDFGKLDYELERARLLGKGLWSVVLLADAKYPACERNPSTPPTSPQRMRQTAPSGVFAVKTPARADAKDVFHQEAMVLTHLMRKAGATQYIVAFHGMDPRNCALIFEAVIGGSLENLNARLRQMTEVARHVELVSLFPGLADDLVSGLEFLHAADVVHADIKPANVLLDISEHYSLPRPVIRARYIDFSASFRRDSDDSTANAGGTWDYMAPEQMRIQRDLSTPTFASDIWSLGITLLYLMVGDSPYTAACGDNVFMLREAIKGGDPLSFARMSPKAQKRMAAAQDFVDCCRLALHRDRERRPTASAWKAWLISREMGAYYFGEAGPFEASGGG